MDAVASPPAVAGRRHHKTLAPGELKGISAAPSVGMSNPFEVLVEDVSVSSDESYAIEVPYEAAMEVIGSPSAPEWSTVARRGGSDEELAADFWSDIGFPTPASRFW
jgi:hypothetical protein